MNPEFAERIATEFQLGTINATERLTGGYESDVWRVESESGMWVIRISPEWRSGAELRWVHAVTEYLHESIPLVIPCRRTLDGDTVLHISGRPVSIQRFVSGSMLDRDNAVLRESAARLLAQIHFKLHQYQPVQPRPASNNDITLNPSNITLPDSLNDPELDSWEMAIKKRGDLAQGVVHGDYYRGNILCEDGRIVAVIDWDESRLGWYVEELAWSVWEFCKADSGYELNMTRAHQFLDVYCGANSLCDMMDLTRIIPFIRLRLREEVRRNLRANPLAGDIDTYTLNQLRAFTTLRHAVL